MKPGNRKLGVLLGALSTAVLLGPSAAWADLFNGSLTSKDGGITATAAWNADPWLKLSWSVTDNGDGTVHYEYRLTGDAGGAFKKGLSHIILQVSDNFTIDDLIDPSIDPEDDDPKTYKPTDPGNSNPGLPGNIFGLKFDGGGSTDFTLSFDSTRGPMWGDFYAKDGKDGGIDVTAWNKSFGVAVADPYKKEGAFSATGAALWKIAVPDTEGFPPDVVPAPGAALLCMLGVSLVGWAKRRIA